jgi:hypothetical protein
MGMRESTQGGEEVHEPAVDPVLGTTRSQIKRVSVATAVGIGLLGLAALRGGNGGPPQSPERAAGVAETADGIPPMETIAWKALSTDQQDALMWRAQQLLDDASALVNNPWRDRNPGGWNYDFIDDKLREFLADPKKIREITDSYEKTAPERHRAGP